MTGEAKSDGSSGRSVLVIDDDRDFADSLATLLRLEGYAVATAYSASEALSLLAEFPASVALVDIRLGQGSGVELVGALRALKPDLAAIMMTAYASVDTAVRALQEGAYDYLCKPFFTDDLLATLGRCFERRRLLREQDSAEAAMRAWNRELETANARLNQILDNSPSAIALKDLEGRYLLTNGKFDDWFDTGRDGLAERWRGAALVSDTKVLARGRAVSQDIEVEHADGSAHALLVTKFRVADGEGQPLGVGTIATDVTEQRQAEQHLRQAQRMEAIGQVTGGVAHDFNNLLAVIIGNLRLLQEQLDERSDGAELLREALDASKAGAELTGRLLAFGRGQALQPRLTDLNALIASVKRMLGRTLGEDIAIRLDLASDLKSIVIDRGQLEASLLNLAINARDAMPGGGELLIGARNVSLDESEARARPNLVPGAYVVLSVVDSGLGMDPEVQRSAVQPFFTTKAPGQGSGLGLSMVYGFVTQSKGHFALTSTVGQGTSVSLYLPASEARAAADEDANADAGEALDGLARGARVLVVEDQPSVRRLMRRLILRLGYEVVEAADGPEALAALEAQPGIDILFTDIVLPGELDGVMLGRKALAAYPQLRVVHTTGYAADNPVLGRLDESVSILLRKPVQIEELSRALRSAMERT